MAADGVTRAACFVTSAYSSYSSCRQYRENLVRRGRRRRGRAGARQAAALLQPPGLRGADGRRDPRGAGRAARRRPRGRAPRLRHPLDPRADERRQRPRRRCVRRAAPQRRWARSSSGSGRRPAAGTSTSWSSARAPAPRTSRGWSPTSTTTSSELHDAGAPGVVMVPIGFVSDHMEVVYDLDTEALATAEKLGLPATRAATAGLDPRFVATVRDLLLERAAVERGEEVVRAAVGALARLLGPLPGRLLPQPARRAPGAGRAPTRERLERRELADARRSTSPGRPRTWCASAPGGRRHRRGHQVQRRRRRHRGRPRQRGADPRAAHAPPGPTTASSARRATTSSARSGVRWIVDPIDGTVNFLYGLPQYAVSIAAERDGEVVAGVVLERRPGTEYVGHLADDAGPAVATRDGEPIAVRDPAPLAPAADRHRLQLRRRDPRAPGRGRGPAARRRSATSAGSARARSTCATSPRAPLDGYVEEGVNLWDHAAGRPDRPDRRRPARDPARRRRDRTWWCVARRTGSTSSSRPSGRPDSHPIRGNSGPSPNVHAPRRGCEVRNTDRFMVHNLAPTTR